MDSKVDNDTFFSEVNSLKDLLNQLMNKGGDIPKVDLNAGNSALKSQIEKLLDRLKDLEKRVETNEGDIGTHNKQIDEIFDLLSKKADKSDLDKLREEMAAMMKQI
jgi:chromosome segregation ATPase